MIHLRILQAFVYLIIIFLHEKFDIHQIASNVAKYSRDNASTRLKILVVVYVPF